MGESRTKLPVFRPRARMILLLGDELIRDAGLAVFELVKNAYDADASRCIVTMENIEDPSLARIIIRDNGSGMTIDTIKRIWLEPGTENKKKQRATGDRTPKGRLPLGEKGVGRFAIHKLGHKISVVTRSAGEKELLISIDWREFDTDRYLSDVPVRIIKRKTAKVFEGEGTGTRIEVSQLRDATWTRGKVRDLARSITSICSPFRGPSGFRARITLKPASDWLEDLLDPKAVTELSLFRASGSVSGNQLTYNYSFVPLPQMSSAVKGRSLPDLIEPLMRPTRKPQPLDLATHTIGEFTFDFFIFDRDPTVLNLLDSDKAGLKKFLDNNGGVRVYRDGVRVFDFGEPGNDWLGLGDRRVQIPTIRVGNNQIIGEVTLDAATSTSLIEKTNREGFIENEAYEDFRQAVLFILTQVEAERAKDKEQLRISYSRGVVKEPVVEEISDLRDAIVKRNLTKELGGYVDRVEAQFEQVRDTLMTAAAAGLTLTTAIHEVEKIIKELVLATKRGAAADRIKQLVEHLDEMVEGLSFLVKHSGMRIEKASTLINQSLFNAEYRFRAHGIHITHGIDNGDPDFKVKCSRRLIVSTLMNLFDNSIYWLESKGGNKKEIYVGTTLDLEGKAALVVADSGPGFRDPHEYLVRPFITRKPDGMGLGLHLANEVAKLHKGQLLFPDPSDLQLPKGVDGAVVAITFPEVS